MYKLKVVIIDGTIRFFNKHEWSHVRFVDNYLHVYDINEKIVFNAPKESVLFYEILPEPYKEGDAE